MFFLMNDAVLDLDCRGDPPPLDSARLRALTLADVLKLGAELYAEQPLLHHEAPDRAKRLARLLLAKAPAVNAALFVAPAAACPPEAVTRRVAEISVDIMADLHSRSVRGELNPVAADNQVWRRLAA